MDYELGVWVLCQQAKRAREKRAREKCDTPAETFPHSVSLNDSSSSVYRSLRKPPLP